jgi:hypothetical protein
VEMVGIRQVLWLVMLESIKGRVLSVDTSGQHVTSRVRYETACLLIRDIVDCEYCSMVWAKTQSVI